MPTVGLRQIQGNAALLGSGQSHPKTISRQALSSSGQKLVRVIEQPEVEASRAIVEARSLIVDHTIECLHGSVAEIASGVGVHLDYLGESLAMVQPILFTDYLEWARLGGVHLGETLECLAEALQVHLATPEADSALEYVKAGLQQLTSSPRKVESFLRPDQPLGELAGKYWTNLLAGERHVASRLITEAVAGGVLVEDVYLQVFQPCQRELGRLWHLGEISVAQEHYCTAATQLIMSQLYPYLFAGERIGRTLVATCIAGDLHEVGVRFVADMFELKGWDTFYLGASTPLDGIVQSVREHKADVLAISITYTPNLRQVKELIRRLRAEPDCSNLKILVGGLPFNVAPSMWREIGADGWAQDALAAVELGNRLISTRA